MLSHLRRPRRRDEKEGGLGPPQRRTATSDLVPSDEDLMVRVQAGETDAYETLFERHRGRVYGFLLRSVRNRELAAELFQETFLKVYRSRKQWQPGRRFTPWLFGIAANTARDRARMMSRRPLEVGLEDWDAPVSTKVEQRLQLEQAIGRLSESQREAFLLGVMEGLDHNELADALGISSANARARVSRARRQLKHLLQEEGA